MMRLRYSKKELLMLVIGWVIIQFKKLHDATKSNLTEEQTNFLRETVSPVSVQVFITIGYIYEVIVIYPYLLENSSPVLLLLIQVLSAWPLIAQFSNLYLVKRRTSLVESRNLAVPFDLTQEKIEMTAQKAKEEQTKVEDENGTGTVSPEENYNDPDNWHICRTCNVFVPPRAWHCKKCNKCILQRDHHCGLSGCCIGEKNHSNFIGLLFYLGTFCTMFTVLSITYLLKRKGITIGFCALMRAFFLLHGIIWEFGLTQVMTAFATTGQFFAWTTFLFYFPAGMKGQTSADVLRAVDRKYPGGKLVSFENLARFIGRKPMQRILWPFHEPHRIEYKDFKQS